MLSKLPAIKFIPYLIVSHILPNMNAKWNNNLAESYRIKFNFMSSLVSTSTILGISLRSAISKLYFRSALIYSTTEFFILNQLMTISRRNRSDVSPVAKYIPKITFICRSHINLYKKLFQGSKMMDNMLIN